MQMWDILLALTLVTLKMLRCITFKVFTLNSFKNDSVQILTFKLIVFNEMSIFLLL